MRKKAIQIAAVVFFCAMLAILAGENGEDAVFIPESKLGGLLSEEEGGKIKEEEKTFALAEENFAVHIPGLKHSYRFIFMSDLHIIVENDEISPESLGNVRARYETFQSAAGKSSSELWEELPDYFNMQQADAVLLGGDMIDYASTANINALRQGIEEMKAPVLYVRADHDYNPYNCEGLDKKDMKKLHESIDGYKGISLIEFEDLCIVGINNSTKQISKGQLKRFQEIAGLGKPIILLTHVPLESKVDASILEESKKEWQDRALVWGEGCYYEPNEATKEFLAMVYDADSPVKAIACGHLHFTWEGRLTESCIQHVFSAMYPGRYGIITVDGEDNGE